MRYEVDLTQVTLALSDALDLVGVNVIQHGKRVAVLALETSRFLGFSPAERHQLLLASVLHDCGVSSTETHREILFHFEWEQSRDHAERGADLLAHFAPLAGVAQFVRHHHTRWSELQASGIDPKVALSANLLFLADRVDALIQQRLDRDILLARRDIQTTLEQMPVGLFAPEAVAAFQKGSQNESLWLVLEPHHLERYLAREARQAERTPMGFDDLRQLADLFAHIVDSKSPFTAQHSRGVARLARFLGGLKGMSGDQCDLLELSGLLHDLGKLRIPDEILLKPGPLTDAEFSQMRRHTFETYQILSRIDGIDGLAEWAAFHHETLTGEGVTFHRSGEESAQGARIVEVADVFQALAAERPYRRSMDPTELLRVMREMAESGKLDPDLVDLTARNADSCWEAAMGLGGLPA